MSIILYNRVLLHLSERVATLQEGKMTEIINRLLIPDIDLDERSPENYPYTAEVQFENGVCLKGMAVWHFNRKRDWQFPVLRDTLAVTVGSVGSTEKWVGLSEGPIPQVDPSGTIEATLDTGGESGVLAWHMGKMGHAMESWDSKSLVAAELAILIDGFDALPDSFRRMWSSKEELGEWYAYLVWERAKTSHLLRLQKYEKDADIGDPEVYILDRLMEKFDAIRLFDDYGIDASKERRLQIHDEVCGDPRLEPALPFDTRVAHMMEYTPEDYYQLHYVPLNVSRDDYYGSGTSYSRIQLLGSFSGDIRNIRFADAINDHVQNRENVFAIGGGGHIARTVPILHERSNIQIQKIEWHIGEAACIAAISEVRPSHH